MKKAIRIISICIIVVAIFAAITASMNSKPANADIVWDQDMTMGDINAKNYYIIYSDLACPYCIFFENAIMEHQAEFEEYLKENDILLEVRLSDFLYEYGAHEAPASRLGANAAYCAKKEGKFWDYYNSAIPTIYNDFFKTSSTAGFTYLNNTDIDYWIEIGTKIGLGEDFEKCTRNQDELPSIMKNAEKTTKLISGMPYFKFNSYTFSGFDPNGDYHDALQYLNAGLKK